MTREGRVLCYGDGKGEPKRYAAGKRPVRSVERWAGEAESILKAAGTKEGYCLVLGIGTGNLVRELARQTQGPAS